MPAPYRPSPGFQWQRIPDPRNIAVLRPLICSRQVALKIAWKHVANEGGPWRDWLSAETVEICCQKNEELSVVNEELIIERLAAELEHGFRLAIARPLVRVERGRGKSLENGSSSRRLVPTSFAMPSAGGFG